MVGSRMWSTHSVGILAAQVAGLVLLLLLVALSVRGYRLSHARPLAFFTVGFASLGASQLALILLEAITAQRDQIQFSGFEVLDVLFWIHYATQIVGAGLLLATFDRRKFKWFLAVGPVLLLAGPIAQILVVALFFLIVVHAGLNHIERSRAGSLQTATGYFLVFCGNVACLFGYEPLTPRTLIGELLVLAGILLLYLAAARPRGADA